MLRHHPTRDIVLRDHCQDCVNMRDLLRGCKVRIIGAENISLLFLFRCRRDFTRFPPFKTIVVCCLISLCNLSAYQRCQPFRFLRNHSDFQGQFPHYDYGCQNSANNKFIMVPDKIKEVTSTCTPIWRKLPLGR